MGKDCRVAATDVDIDASATGTVTATWTTLVRKACKRKDKVAVGVFKSGSKYYKDLLTCKPDPAAFLKDQGTITCTVNKDCVPGENDYAFSYDVCFGGEALFDPELRIKGSGRPRRRRQLQRVR